MIDFRVSGIRAGIPNKSCRSRSPIVNDSQTTNRESQILLSRFKRQRHTVDAVTQTGRRRTIGEDVPEVSAALAAMHFSARHPVAAIDRGADAPFDRRKETGPAGATLEIALGHEERLPAARAREHAGAVLPEERTRTRRLGGVIAKHRVLLRRQLPAPLLVRLGDGKCRFVHGFSMPRPLQEELFQSGDF